MKQTLLNTVRILTALILIAVSIFMASDPLNFSYFIGDVLSHVFAKPLEAFALLLTYLMLITQFSLGFMLLTKFLLKLAIKVNFGLSVIYLIISFILARTHFVPTNKYFIFYQLFNSWYLFFLSVLYFSLSIVIFLFAKKYKPAHLIEKYQLSWTLTAASFILLFAFFNYTFLPIIDLSKFRTGSCLKKILNETIYHKKYYRTYLYYENKQTKQIKVFSEHNYPWRDTTHWKWLKTEIQSFENKFKIRKCNFEIINPLGQNITDSILNIKTPVLLIIAQDLNLTNLRGFVKTLKFAREFTGEYFPVAYCLTASSQRQIDSIIELTGAYDIEFCKSDKLVLRQMVKANPGIMIIRNGQILMKRNFFTLPKLKKFNFYMSKTNPICNETEFSNTSTSDTINQ